MKYQAKFVLFFKQPYAIIKMKIKGTWNQVPYKKLSSCFWEKQEQHGSYGEVGTPHSLRRRSWRLKMRFDLKPEAIIHDLRVFRKLYILCVCFEALCRAFKCLHSVFLFSPPLTGWSIHTGGLP